MSRSTLFLGLESEIDGADRAAAVILPVPYDGTSTWHKGADRGPEALLKASASVELYDIETGTEPWRHGIATLPPLEHDGTPEELAREVHRRVSEILRRDQLPIVLGGEHSVTIGAVTAAAEVFEDVSVLQIDAHGDTRETYEGSTHNHACVMARAREVAPIVQVGLRSVDSSEMERLDSERIFWAHDIVGRADQDWMDRAVDQLSEAVYVTIDLDAFDPSIMPATGTPEPGGFGWYDVTELLRRVSERRRVVGFDVVELAPQPGQHACDLLAAKLVYRFLAIVFALRRVPEDEEPGPPEAG